MRAARRRRINLARRTASDTNRRAVMASPIEAMSRSTATEAE